MHLLRLLLTLVALRVLSGRPRRPPDTVLVKLKPEKPFSACPEPRRTSAVALFALALLLAGTAILSTFTPANRDRSLEWVEVHNCLLKNVEIVCETEEKGRKAHLDINAISVASEKTSPLVVSVVEIRGGDYASPSRSLDPMITLYLGLYFALLGLAILILPLKSPESRKSSALLGCSVMLIGSLIVVHLITKGAGAYGAAIIAVIITFAGSLWKGNQELGSAR